MTRSLVIFFSLDITASSLCLYFPDQRQDHILEAAAFLEYQRHRGGTVVWIRGLDDVTDIGSAEQIAETFENDLLVS